MPLDHWGTYADNSLDWIELRVRKVVELIDVFPR